MKTEEVKLTRPDLSALTSGEHIPLEGGVYQMKLRAWIKTPELIQIAEMMFDQHKSNPDSLVFQMASKVLNDIKPE